MDFVKDYIAWLKDNMTQVEINDDITELTTPFLDRHNDYTQIYIIKTDTDAFKISDDGYIISDLEASGIDVLNGKIGQLFKHILSRQGISFNKDTLELYVDISGKKNIPFSQHRLLQAMLDVNDLFYLSKTNVAKAFVEDVISFFDANDIFYTENVSVGGKTGYMHAFDFVLQKNKTNPERFVRVLNNADKANMERVLFSWQDIKDNRKDDSKLIVLLNDLNKTVSPSVVDAFKQYDVNPIMWSNRNSVISQLN